MSPRAWYDDDVDASRSDQWPSRETIARIADTADDVAATLDRVADTREELAASSDLHDDDALRRAQRARSRAQSERDDSQRIRKDWDLPPRS